MSLNLIRIYDICRDQNTLLENLQNWGLIPRQKNCPKCFFPMDLCKNEDKSWMWYCSNKVSFRKQKLTKCNKKVEG